MNSFGRLTTSIWKVSTFWTNTVSRRSGKSTHEGGTREQFTESNDRFYRNGKTAAFAAYSWYDPRRYLVWNKARQFRNLCQLFGWEGWKKNEVDN